MATRAFAIPAMIFSFTLLMCGCEHQQGAPSSEETLKIEMPEVSQEFYLPAKVWDTITGSDFQKAVRQATSLIFAPITVRLEERTEGVLSKPVIILNFPRGGGDIDFAKYVKAERGTFQVFFETEAFANPTLLNVFFISKSKERKIDGELYGSGCHHYYDIKDYLLKENQKEGLVVNVTRDRHDSALGGHFIFGYKKGLQTLVSEVGFWDSRRPDLFCEEAKR